MKLNKIAILVVLVALQSFVLAGTASADYLPGEKTQADQVEGIEMIHSYLLTEQFVPSRLEFRKLSADAVADLVKISNSSSYNVVVRARALQSLALYRDDVRAVGAIDGMMKKLRAGHRLYPPAVVAYGAVHGDTVVEEMIELAQHKRKDVRMAAVVALGRFGGQTGIDTLAQLVETEKDEQVLARITAYVN